MATGADRLKLAERTALSATVETMTFKLKDAPKEDFET